MQEQIKKLIDEELARGNAKNGPFVDSHQGYAVILEEYEEAKEELEAMEYNIGMMWNEIRGKMKFVPPLQESVDAIYKRSIRLTEEAIQIGAMAVKMSQLLKVGQP